MKLAYEQLKRISDSVGERTGWNFSRVRAERASVPWNYPDVARQFLTPPTMCSMLVRVGARCFFF